MFRTVQISRNLEHCKWCAVWENKRERKQKGQKKVMDNLATQLTLIARYRKKTSKTKQNTEN
jgi:hypothetical protein